jgi:GTP-binding protein Era
MSDKSKTYAGFVAILGAPNAGKSTLLNRMIGQKISITSPKPQTTRMRTLGVLTEGKVQIGFIDTPGIFAGTPQSRLREAQSSRGPKMNNLDQAMVKAAWQSLDGANAVVLLVDAGARQPDEKTDAIIAALQQKKQRVILALNKIDAIERQALLPLTARLNLSGIVDDTFMISALNGDGIDDLKKHLAGMMPESPLLYPEDQLSDLPERLLAAEATREQLFRQLQQELPYSAAVVPETWETKKDGSAVIRQTILVAREGHKPIVLGKGGARIKAIGEAARKDIERMLGHKVHLFLEVKVDEKWQDRPEFYQLFGLDNRD